MPTIEEWPISKLLSRWDKLNLAPKYQRGKVWDDRRNILLIDSILNGMDIPKVYLHPVRDNAFFDFEVIDGQQRLRAIHAFAERKFALVETDGVVVTGGKSKFIDELSVKKQKIFRKYRLTISIAKVSPNDARVLFSRLQLGATLNQAELRNALASNACHEIDSIVLNHRFFSDCRIAETRFKRHDYLTHVLAYSCAKERGVTIRDIKAAALRQFVIDHAKGLGAANRQTCDKVLGAMADINDCSPGVFRNKWTFVDTYLFLWSDKAHRNLPPAMVAKALKRIERQRRQFNMSPEVLLTDTGTGVANPEAMYHYISAYKAGGAMSDSITTRLKLLTLRLGKLSDAGKTSD